jgi:hypothetical protein
MRLFVCLFVCLFFKKSGGDFFSFCFFVGKKGIRVRVVVEAKKRGTY